MAAIAASIFKSQLPTNEQTAPFSSNHGCEQIAPVSHQGQASSNVLLSPWRFGCPRKALVPLRVQWTLHRFVATGLRCQLLAGSRFKRSVCCSGDGERCPVQLHGYYARAHLRTCRCRRHSCETAPYIRGLLFFQYVVTRPCQLVRQRPGGDRRIRFAFLRS